MLTEDEAPEQVFYGVKNLCPCLYSFTHRPVTSQL